MESSFLFPTYTDKPVKFLFLPDLLAMQQMMVTKVTPANANVFHGISQHLVQIFANDANGVWKQLLRQTDGVPFTVDTFNKIAFAHDQTVGKLDALRVIDYLCSLVYSDEEYAKVKPQAQEQEQEWCKYIASISKLDRTLERSGDNHFWMMGCQHGIDTASSEVAFQDTTREPILPIRMKSYYGPAPELTKEHFDALSPMMQNLVRMRFVQAFILKSHVALREVCRKEINSQRDPSMRFHAYKLQTLKARSAGTKWTTTMHFLLPPDFLEVDVNLNMVPIDEHIRMQLNWKEVYDVVAKKTGADVEHDPMVRSATNLIKD